jgi:hypothetical protein
MCKRGSDTVTVPFWQYLPPQHSLRVIHCWWCRSGNEGIEWIFELIIELLTSSLVKNTNHWKKNMNYNIVDLATCKTCKMWLRDVKWSILTEYYNRIAKASILYSMYRWTRCTTHWKPAQFRRIGRCRWNCTRMDSSGLLTTRVANLAPVRFRPVPGPEVTVQTRCQH